MSFMDISIVQLYLLLVILSQIQLFQIDLVNWLTYSLFPYGFESLFEELSVSQCVMALTATVTITRLSGFNTP